MNAVPRIVLIGLSVALLSACQPAQQEQAAAPAVAEPAPLLARADVFDNPVRSGGRISPDGNWLGYLAPDAGVMNVWVEPADGSSPAKVITQDRHRGIRNFSFAQNSQHVLFSQDQNGDENFHLYAVNLATGEKRDLTPFPNTRSELQQISAQFPNEVLVSMNNRNPQYFDVHRVNIVDGSSKLVQKNDEYSGFVTDDNFAVRFASKQTPDGGAQMFKADAKKGFVPHMTIGQADSLTTQLIGFTSDGNTYYLIDSRERNTGALFAVDAASEERSLVFEDPKSDVSDAIAHPVTGRVQAVASNYLKPEWHVIDSAIQKDMDYLKTLGDGEISVTSRSNDDQHWTVVLSNSNSSSKYYRYDRAAGKATMWFDVRPVLADKTLSPMHAVEVPARDGLKLVSYYTLPSHTDGDNDGKPTEALPMVLLVHGGPWARDQFGFSSTHQWLANRGYAVMSVNYRGSTGFGKDFTNAGDLQWGLKMHDDLLDAVDWAVAQGIAKPDQAAIMGGSYGGYATLAGVTLTPEKFACGVDIVGPSNLITLLETIPPYWAPVVALFHSRMGNPNTEEGKALLMQASPLTHVDKIVRPLLIGQGANDPRVKQSESDQIVTAMKAKNIPVTYVLYPDEGHGFAKPENRMSFNAVAESFLGQCLGGRVEGPGAEFANSSIQIPEGIQHIPEIAAAMTKPEAKPEATPEAK